MTSFRQRGSVPHVVRGAVFHGARHLSKNNNNILRLRTIAAILPEATILIPVRDPLDHAVSLMKQHANFIRQQARDRFVRDYMTFLVHHEFGLDHRPFRFSDEGMAALRSLEPDTPDYWLELWCQAHVWLERTAPGQAVFVPYEDLCRDPVVWQGIARLCGISTDGNEESLVMAAPSGENPACQPRLDRARALYSRLRERGLAALSPA